METKTINSVSGGEKKENKNGKGKNVAMEGAKVAGAAVVGAGAAFAASAAFSSPDDVQEEIVAPTDEENVVGNGEENQVEEEKPKADAPKEEVNPDEIVISHEQVEEILGPQDIAVVEVEPVEGEPSITPGEDVIAVVTPTDPSEIIDPGSIIEIDPTTIEIPEENIVMVDVDPENILDPEDIIIDGLPQDPGPGAEIPEIDDPTFFSAEIDDTAFESAEYIAPDDII
ncbi:MAG: hypothetical protein K2N05_07580 [Muribaculaceae bacterium]|nr:hypothetical protein [Muribaculaceae bacterium]